MRSNFALGHVAALTGQKAELKKSQAFLRKITNYWSEAD